MYVAKAQCFTLCLSAVLIWGVGPRPRQQTPDTSLSGGPVLRSYVSTEITHGGSDISQCLFSICPTETPCPGYETRPSPIPTISILEVLAG